MEVASTHTHQQVLDRNGVPSDPSEHGLLGAVAIGHSRRDAADLMRQLLAVR